MDLNSFNFFLFFGMVFGIYYLPFVRKASVYQNAWLLIVSILFYGVAEWRMIPLLFGSIVIFYFIGKSLKKQISKGNAKAASIITTIGVSIGIGTLIYYKYLNFFADSFSLFLSFWGFKTSWATLNIVLPLGVSFFTFKLISYIIEIHREHIEPSTDFIEFATYIAFFPTLLAGPIDRPNNFIPQLRKVRYFDYSLAVSGCRQVLWGMFTKMCVADNLALITKTVWADYGTYSSSTLVIAALLYPLEIYADFDGYSNMAIGIGKLLGLNVTRNFNHPLLGRTTAEYWRRWHMSLTAWVTDYVYMPLSVSFMKLRSLGVILAVIINMLVIGLWHGANWTYCVFGLYHGLLFIPLVLMNVLGKGKRLNVNKRGLPMFKDVIMMIGTYFLVAVGHVFFVSPSVPDAVGYLSSIIHASKMSSCLGISIPFFLIVFCAIIILLDWLMRDKEYSLDIDNVKLFNNRWIRFCLYTVLIVFIYVFQGEPAEFIYFNF